MINLTEEDNNDLLKEAPVKKEEDLNLDMQSFLKIKHLNQSKNDNYIAQVKVP